MPMKKNGPGFNPEEIIFCPTSLCNLKCAHCYVNQKNTKLDIQSAITLLEDCAASVEDLKVGFSGGEPFLNLDFVTAICSKAIDLDLMFDRLMTNGVWWKNQQELEEKLSAVADSGFDGKIGLSFDSFHNQDFEKIVTFIKTCHNIWRDNSCVELLSVINPSDSENENADFEKKLEELKKRLDVDFIPYYRFPQSFVPSDKIQFNDEEWFAEDYCQATGNTFYVHSDGNISPCCGFANELKELYIGTVNDSFKTLMNNAAGNRMVGLCYDEGLLETAKKMQVEGKLPEGKCSDMCQLCYWMCVHPDC